MTALYSAHKVQVFIGDDQQDWSATFGSLDLGFEKRSRDGKFPVTGTLTLKRVLNAPEVMNPRINQERWARSQPIRVFLTDSSGTVRPHPAGVLFILKEPAPMEMRGVTFTLSVGCQLALNDYAEPAGPDQSGIELGVTTSRTDAIAALLAYAGVSNWAGSVPDYPLNYPLPKQAGSYVGQAGAIAFAGFKALWQDEQGHIQAIDLRLNANATPLLTVTIGHDEIGYTPSQGSETPVEQLVAASTTYDVLDTWQTISDCSESFGPPGDGAPAGSATILRKVCTYDAQDADSKTHEVVVYEARGLLFPDDFPGDLTLGFSSDTVEAYDYEKQYIYTEGVFQERRYGKLLDKFKTVRRPFAAALREFWSNLSDAEKANYFGFSPLLAERELTYYRYSVLDQVASVDVQSSAPLAAIDPNLDPTSVSPSALTPSARTVERWTKRLPGEWEHVSIQEAPLLQAFPDAVAENASESSKVALVTTDYEPTVSGSQNQPPAAERKGDRYDRQDRIIRGSANFAPFAGSNAQLRTRTIEVPYCVSADQLDTIALYEGQLLPGRRMGQTVKLPFLDVFILNPGPLPTIACREPRAVQVSGHWTTVYDVIVYQADALHYLLNPTEGMVVFDGIWLLSIAGDTGNLSFPTQPMFALSAGLGMGCTLEMVPYHLNLPALVGNAGLGLGANLALSIVTILPQTVTVNAGLGLGANLGLTIISPQTLDISTGLGLGATLIPSTSPPQTVTVNAGLGLGADLSFTAGAAETYLLDVAGMITFSIDTTGTTLIQIDTTTFQIG